jgi:hypothetical protein
VKALGDTLAPHDVILAASCANMPNGSTICQNYFVRLSVLALDARRARLQNKRYRAKTIPTLTKVRCG